jgi:hypothetical protein
LRPGSGALCFVLGIGGAVRYPDIQDVADRIAALKNKVDAVRRYL